MKSAPPVRQISQNIFLRPPVEADAGELSLLANEVSVRENLRDVLPFPYTPEDALDYISLCRKEQPPLSFGIFYQNRFAGMAGLVPGKDVNRITGEVGYWVGRQFRGQGIATEAVREMMRYAWQEFGFYKLTACVFEGNTASVRVLEKCGFIHEATLKGNALKNGEIKDEWRFACFNPQYNPRRFGMGGNMA